MSLEQKINDKLNIFFMFSSTRTECYELAKKLLKEDKEIEARKIYEVLAETMPSDAKAFLGVGDCLYISCKKADKPQGKEFAANLALKAYEKAMKADPSLKENQEVVEKIKELISYIPDK